MGANAPKPRINPDQIPSPVKTQTDDQETYGRAPFGTSTRGVVPMASTRFDVIDEGNSNPKFMRSTLYKLPVTEELANNSQLPMALVIQPLAKLSEKDTPIPLVDHGENGPIRCNRCKGYINPLCTFVDGGRRFVCSLCQFANEVPDSYFCNLDMMGRRMDLESRPELLYGTCEFVATAVSRPSHICMM
jgi:protein transport protein SEC24